ncbi:MAG TPA: PrsW family glutamic-type intramembrane protease [Anaerolineales bacterium]|nr:PrsW family glutamic-type intramembrane protease [Anaerolineales bacterium]
MQIKPSKFWAYIALIAGILLLLGGLAATITYFNLPFYFPVENALAYEVGSIAAIYLGLVVGGLAFFHGFGSIAKYKSSPFRLPTFYIFWIILGLVLGLGVLVIEIDISTELLFPPLFVFGAALSVFAVIAWAYRKMGFPITWRQTSLAFVSGSTLSIIVTLMLGSLLTYVIYMLVSPFWYLAEEIAYLGWGAPGFIERIFASPFIFVFLVVTALEAPIPEEFAKALGIPLFGRGRIQNERQAFAIGLASGAGFAILENMLYEGMYAQYYGWGWAGITLLRSIGTVLHPLGTGIIALGWFRMKEGGGAGKLFKAYLLSVGLHTLWNGGFEPLIYLTGLEYFAGAGPSLSLYGETLSVLLVGYLVLLSLGLWWLLRKIVNEISERVTPDLAPASVSKRAIAAWAVACALVIVPIGAALSPAWEEIRLLILGN